MTLLNKLRNFTSGLAAAGIIAACAEPSSVISYEGQITCENVTYEVSARIDTDTSIFPTYHSSLISFNDEKRRRVKLYDSESDGILLSGQHSFSQSDYVMRVNPDKTTIRIESNKVQIDDNTYFSVDESTVSKRALEEGLDELKAADGIYKCMREHIILIGKQDITNKIKAALNK